MEESIEGVEKIGDKGIQNNLTLCDTILKKSPINPWPLPWQVDQKIFKKSQILIIISFQGKMVCLLAWQMHQKGVVPDQQ